MAHLQTPDSYNRNCPIHSRMNTAVPVYTQGPLFWHQQQQQQQHLHGQHHFSLHRQAIANQLRPQQSYHHYINPTLINPLSSTNSPPVFPFSSTIRSFPMTPPMYHIDYSLHMNLPAPPLHKIFDLCRIPRWWSDAHSSQSPAVVSPPIVSQSSISGHPEYSDLLEMYKIDDNNLQQMYSTIDDLSQIQQAPSLLPPVVFSPPPPVVFSPPPSVLFSPPFVPSTGTIADIFPVVPLPRSQPPLLPFSDKEPQYSFSALSALAITSYQHKMATLTEIYTFISTTFPFYKRSQRAWKNSIRNCLHNNECFKRSPFLPPEDKSGKNVYWIMDPYSKTHFLKGSFKVKRHSSKKNTLKKYTREEINRGYFDYQSMEVILHNNTNICELFPSPKARQKPHLILINTEH